MNIEDLEDFDLIPLENKKEGCEILCPNCLNWSNHTEWKMSTVECDVCLYHDAIECPKCSRLFDHVYSTLECRI